MGNIDIVIPSYQYGRYLGECITSILTQGVEDLRILVIDNASTDDSVEVARQFAAKDPRIEVRAREQNLGFHASLNEGIDWASGKYFLIVCADDLMAPGSLRRALGVLDANEDVAFVYGSECIWESSQPLPDLTAPSGGMPYALIEGQQFIEALSMPQAAIGTGSFVTRTRCQKRAGYFRPELYYTDDIEMLMRLACFGCTAKLNAVQGVRRRHGNNISADYWGDWRFELKNLLDAYESFFNIEGAALLGAESIRCRVRRNIAHRAYWAGVSHRLRGLKPASAALLAFARSIDPTTRFMPPISYWLRVENAERILAEKARELIVSRFFPTASGSARGEA